MENAIFRHVSDSNSPFVSVSISAIVEEAFKLLLIEVSVTLGLGHMAA